MNPVPKIKNYRNNKYLEFIRSKPSLKSGKMGTKYNPTRACHQTFGKAGTSIKSPDIFTVPLLNSEHVVEHLGHDTFWGNENLELRCLEYIAEFLSLNKGRKI